MVAWSGVCPNLSQASQGAPACTKIEHASRQSACAAQWSAVAWHSSPNSTWAPRRINMQTTNGCWCTHAAISGVVPNMSRESTSAPSSISVAQASKFPAAAAQCSGLPLRGSWVGVLMARAVPAPQACAICCSIDMLDLMAARCTAVRPAGL
eukprot:1269756-Pyramimonas_sp.AAC.1